MSGGKVGYMGEVIRSEGGNKAGCGGGDGGGGARSDY